MTVTNLTPPVISGTTVQGNALHSTPGTWTSTDPLSYAYQWERCDGAGANCVDISGAVSSNYILASADVGHTIRVRVTATENVTPPLPPPPLPGTWLAPITITQGGTYTGNWESKTSQPAITIATTAPVIIENSNIRNVSANGYIIDAYHSIPGSGIDVTIRNCFIYGGDVWASPRWFVAQNWKNLLIQNNTIENTRGIELWPNNYSNPTTVITRNRHHNIKGTTTGANLNDVGNFVQFRVVGQATDLEVSWNEIINEYNRSNPEDLVSIYKTAHTRVHDNMFWHHSKPSVFTGSSQNGITIDPADQANLCFDNIIEDNQLVEGYSPASFGGDNNQLLGNRVVSNGYWTSDNSVPMTAGFEGIWVAPGYTGNHAHNNVIGYIGSQGRNDGRLNGTVEGDGNGNNTGEWANNTHLNGYGGSVTQADKDAEWTSWVSKKAANGITVGASSATGETVRDVPTTIDKTGGTDTTAALQAWIDSIPNGSIAAPQTLRFSGGTYRIDSQLTMTSRSYLTFDLSATTFQWNTALDDNMQGMLKFVTCAGIVVKSGTLLGTYSYPPSGDAHVPTYQHMHAIMADRSNVGVQGMTISGFYGDGVYFGSLSGSQASSGYVRGCDIRKVGRNCVSVVAGDGVTIDGGNHFQQAGFVGIDLEPNDGGAYVCRNITVSGNTWGGQVGTTQRVCFRILSSSTVPVTDVQFTSNSIVGRSGDIDINVTGTQGTRVARVTLTGNSADTAGSNEEWTLKQTDTLTVSGNTIPVSSGTVIGLYDSTNYSISGSTYTVH